MTNMLRNMGGRHVEQENRKCRLRWIQLFSTVFLPWLSMGLGELGKMIAIVDEQICIFWWLEGSLNHLGGSTI